MSLSVIGALSDNGKVAGSTPSQKPAQVAGLIPSWGLWRQPINWCFSLRSMSVCLSLFLSLSLFPPFPSFPQMKMKALAGVAQWIEHCLVNQRVADLIPSQGTCLGCGPGPQCGPRERQPHIYVSLPLFLFPFPSLKINK